MSYRPQQEGQNCTVGQQGYKVLCFAYWSIFGIKWVPSVPCFLPICCTNSHFHLMKQHLSKQTYFSAQPYSSTSLRLMCSWLLYDLYHYCIITSSVGRYISGIRRFYCTAFFVLCIDINSGEVPWCVCVYVCVFLNVV